MTVKEAAKQVLATSGQPMHAHELAKQMIAQGLWVTNGQTPGATVSAALYTDVKRNGPQSWFVCTSPQVFGLNHAVVDADHTEPPQHLATHTDSAIQPMSFIKAAYQVLKQQNMPMHYQQITKAAQQLGLLTSEGQTPSATMGARLYMDVKMASEQGKLSLFTSLGHGQFGLRAWQKKSLLDDIDHHNAQVRLKLLNHIKGIDPQQFETLISVLLTKMGFVSVEVTKYSHDGGIDVRGVMEISGSLQVSMVIQAKRTAANVQSTVVRELRGSFGLNERGCIITTAGFSKGAIKEAQRPDRSQIALIDGDALVTLLTEHHIGIEHKDVTVLELSVDTMLE